MEENRFALAMYFVKKELPDKTWDVVMIMVTHVDDLAWSDTPESQEVIAYLKSKFPIEKEKTGEFKFTGHEITQDEDCTVRLRCRDTTLKMEKIKIGYYRPEQPNRKRVAVRKEGEERAATPSEFEQFRSVSGSLIWL